MKSLYLTPLALGGGYDENQREKLDKVDSLRAEIIRRAFDFDLPPGSPLKDVRNAVGWTLLKQGARAGIIERVSGKSFAAGYVLGALIYSELDTIGEPDGKKGLSQLAARAVKATGSDADKLRVALIGQLLRKAASDSQSNPAIEGAPGSVGSSRKSNAVADMDLHTFAARAMDAARQTKTGRYGSKVFINHVHAMLADEGVAMSLDEFKDRLLEANREDVLRLARADLVPAMNADDVRASKTTDNTATFHFIRLA